MEFKTLNRKALGCMYTATGLGILIAIAVFTFIMYFFSLFSYPVIKVLYFLLVAVLAADGICSPPFRYRRYRYAIDEECIDIREGYLWTEEHIVPMERLHQITMAQGPIDRMFGLTKVIVTTAGGEVTIRFLEYEKAQLMVESLKKKINQIAIATRQNTEFQTEETVNPKSDPASVTEQENQTKEDCHGEP